MFANQTPRFTTVPQGARLALGGDGFRVQGPGLAHSYKRAINYPNIDRFELRYNEMWSGDTLLDRERTEIEGQTKWDFGRDFWLSFDQIIYNSGPITPNYCVLLQFHSTLDAGDYPNGLSPPLMFNISPAQEFQLITRSDANYNSPSNPPEVVRFADPNFEFGRRYRHVLRIKAHWTNGELQYWRDGVEMFNLSIPLGYNDAVGWYLKRGIYRNHAPETVVAYYGNTEIGYASLFDRVANPRYLPPLPAP